ncbi:MAG: GAF domain-containing serine/threonine-protein kinase [Fimbriiglobus sp.]
MGLPRLCPDGERVTAVGGRVEAHVRDCPRCLTLAAADAAKVARSPETVSVRAAPPHIAPSSGGSLPGLSDTTMGDLLVAALGLPDVSTEDSATRLLRVGQFGRYRVEKLLGRGGMGAVVRAFDPVLDRTVAIKVLHARAGGPAANAAFLKEARAAAGIHNDHVVLVYTFGEENGVAYLVMQYCPGGSLQTRIDSSAQMSREEIVDIARQAARGLAAAHARGLVHRDVKPSNLLIEPIPGGRRVRVADFGLCHTAATPLPEKDGCVAGTPAYMPPEQVNGQPVDASSDLYSLGVILFQMVVGRLPFVANTPDELMRMHVITPAPVPSQVCPGVCSPDMEALIVSLLKKDPAARPQSVAEVLARLDAIADGDSITPAERARLAALDSYKVLDSAPDPVIDALTHMASQVAGTPIALVTLIDKDRQWVKSRVGIQVTQTARNMSFCTHVVAEAAQVVVPDTTEDPRFRDHPAVRANPNIRFYVGTPLTTGAGDTLGSLCVVDQQTRQMTPEQLSALSALSRLVMNQLELQRNVAELRDRLGVEPPNPN